MTEAAPAPDETDRGSDAVRLILLFAAGFAIRWLLAVVLLPEGGHRGDLQILTDWTHQLVATGPAAFYRADSGFFADYPPLYLYVLWLTGLAGRAWSEAFGGADVTPFMIKLPLMLADLGVAWVAMRLTGRLWGRRAGVIAAAVCLFNPAFILVSSVWGQNDPLATLILLSAIYLLVIGRTEWATVAAVLAMLFKFQYGFAIPIVAIVGLRRHVLAIDDGDGTRWPREVRRVGVAAVAGLVTLLVAIRPFGLYLTNGADPSHSLIHRFLEASKAFPGVTQNAFNLWMNPLLDVVRVGPTGLTQGHIVEDAAPVVAGLSWQAIGNVLFVAAVLLALAVFRRRSDGVAIVVVSLAIAVAFFVLPTRIHERYLYPALALSLPLLAAGVAWPRLHVILSAVLFLDVYWVYTLPLGNLGPGRGILADTLYRPEGIYAVSAIATGTMAWLLWRVARPSSLPWAAGVIPSPRSAGSEPRGAAVDTGSVPAPDEPSSLDLARAETAAAAAAGLRPLERWVARIRDGVRAAHPPDGLRSVVVLALLSLAVAFVAARVRAGGGPWLWNLDMPKIDFPLAVFFHDALAAGRLPLWDDHLSLGFPLYAEGQIGAFYPPNWVLFQAPPLVAMDLSRLFHLTLVGTGAGLLTLRLAGTRLGAAVTAITVVLGAAVAAKLQWLNLIAAFAWLPWVLLPLIRRPGPTRAGLVAAGVVYGVQALAGHPNVWLLTGLAAAVVMLTIAPRPRTLARVVGLGLLGGAIGAVQLVPTVLLTTLSVRSEALSPNDLFASAATPFDVLLFGFQNAFARVSDGAWDIYTMWYPDGTFALLEAAAYVGLPVLVLAAVAIRVRRARPFVVLIVVALAIPTVAAFRPEIWTRIPILDSLRSPVRSYLLVSFALAVLAGIGVGRLGRSPGARRRAAIVLVAAAAAYAVTLGVAVGLPSVFDAVLLASSTFLASADVESRRELAVSALIQPWPLVLELVVGGWALAIVAEGRRRPALRLGLAPIAAIVAAIPLVLLGALPNPSRPATDFSFAGTEYVQAVAATDPRRFVALDPPGWYAGMPDQLAAARIPDLRMFSSLDLKASNDVVERVARADPDGELRRALGVDVVATFDKDCPGSPLATVKAEGGAELCRDDAARRPPYWLPADAVTLQADQPSTPVRPRDAAVDLSVVARDALDLAPRVRDTSRLDVAVDAPAAGWVWIDRAWWPDWQATVDGTPVETVRALGGQLVAVPAGHHDVTEVFMPWDAALGALIGLAGLGLALAWWWRPWARVSPSARRRS